MDLSKYKRVHFIGIGGISMSGLAEILSVRGFEVSGSDIAASALTARLSGLGLDIKIGHSEENLPDNGLVVYTAAVGDDNPEMAAAKARGLDVIDRARLLGLLMSEYQFAICVSGAHGKTTTTAMVSEIFIAAGADPTITVGGILPSIGGNIRLGRSEYFIAEACEYRDSFLKFSPYVGIILNIELDHVDYFKNIEQMTESFRKFAHTVRPGGVLVINAETPDLNKIIKGFDRRVITFGPGGDLFARDIRFNDNGCAEFKPVYKGSVMPRMRLRVPGGHNISDALAAMAAAL
ncbi:MAG: Mur ligase domain-containing protein, partial [Defluviitaleaceae bacterium]|nr:Mur ligase domain-containing protein [Defluviitaleaceae bacterium]